MKRRSFIKSGTGLTIPFVLGGLKISALENPLFNSLELEDDKVLVLVQLNGGNDGLNMICPLDQYDNLAQVRSNILLPENDLLKISDTLALHPVMGDMRSVYDNAKLNIIQGVGYPNQNRSHFRSSDIWHSGSSAEEVWEKGWLGRYFELFAPNYPTGYPNEEYPDPFAITIGNTVNETCEGTAGNFSLALANANNLSALATPINGSNSGTCHGDKIDFLTTSIIQTNAYNATVETANDNGNNLSTKYTESKLSEGLKLVARLIAGGMGTKVYIVQLGGFDTHDSQVMADNPTMGEHAELLADLSSSICAFQDDIELMGLDQRVMGMTYSEFGRRIRSNASFGTDHGSAAPMLLFGSCVNPGVIGNNAEISVDIDEQEGVAMQYDFRSVYGSILMDWFNLDEQVVKDLLYQDFQYMPIIKNCNPISNNQLVEVDKITLEVFPNPFFDKVDIKMEIPGGHTRISLYDAIGHEIKVISNQKLTAGTHHLTVSLGDQPSGSYYIRVQTEFGVEVKRVMRMK